MAQWSPAMSTFHSFGELLKYLRHRSQMTQKELAVATGYSEGQISRLESNLRVPDEAAIKALFIPALQLEDEPDIVSRLLVLAVQARAGTIQAHSEGETAPTSQEVAEVSPSSSSASEPGVNTNQAVNPIVDAGSRTNNLPAELTSFIGRERELERLADLLTLGPQRLVTLIGAGGTGKTRLALRLGKKLVTHFPDGAWLVELAPLSDPGLVALTIAKVLGMDELQGKPTEETLASYLEKKNLLLILDNCEHLLQECSRLADLLLKRCPKLVLLATSREMLNLRGEIAFRVPSLSLPDPDKYQPEQLKTCEAVQLFMDRARQTVPDFYLDEYNSASVATICLRLDGVPLAIELAAARMRVLSPTQIVDRLDRVFHLLTGGARNTLHRHQTLKAAIDWSYDMLQPRERTMLQRLSVFAGSWDLEAAEMVCTGQGIDQPEVLDLLTGLVDKSLVQPYQGTALEEQAAQHQEDQRIGNQASNTNWRGEVQRYHMLETVRQYCQDRLQETGESDAIRDRHLDYYLALGERAGEEITGPKQIAWVNRLEHELENLRLALEWALNRRIEAGLRLASATVWFWHIHNRETEAAGWLEKILTADGSLSGDLPKFANEQDLSHSLHRIRARNAACFMQFYTAHALTREQLIRILEENIQLCRAIGQPASRELAWAIQMRASLRPRVERELANREYMESVAISRQYGYRFHEVLCQLALDKSIYEMQQGADIYERCLTICESLGDTDLTAQSRVHLALWLFYVGEHQRPRNLLKEGLAFYQKIGNRAEWSSWVIWQYQMYPEPANARQAEAAMAYLLDREPDGRNLTALCILAEVDWSQENCNRAERLARFVLEANQKAADPFCSSFAHLILSQCALQHTDLRNAASHIKKIDTSWMDRQGLNLWVVKIIFDTLATYLTKAQEWVSAAMVLGAADRVYHAFEPGSPQRSRDEHDAAVKAACLALGEAAYAAAWQEGQRMTLTDAFVYGLRFLNDR